LVETVSGESNDLARASETAGLLHGHIILPDMHPVGSGFGYEGGMVVENKRHSGAPAERNEKPRELKDVSGEEAFCAQLKDFNSAFEHLGGNARDIYRGDIAHIQNAVESKFVEVEVHFLRPSGLQEQFPPQIGFAFF